MFLLLLLLYCCLFFSNRPNVFFFDLIDCYRVGPAVLSQGCPTPQVGYSIVCVCVCVCMLACVCVAVHVCMWCFLPALAAICPAAYLHTHLHLPARSFVLYLHACLFLHTGKIPSVMYSYIQPIYETVPITVTKQQLCSLYYCVTWDWAQICVT